MAGPQPKKQTDFEPEEIQNYLARVRKFIEEDNYIIPVHENRQKNKRFMEDYKINTRREKEIITGLTYEDFCYAVNNEKEEYSHETLYVFCKELELNYFGEKKKVEVYLKFNLIDTEDNKELIVISFHE